MPVRLFWNNNLKLVENEGGRGEEGVSGGEQ